MASPNTSITFKVHRLRPELIRPSLPTLHEFKPLSDIDDQDSLRFQVPFAHFYPYNPSQRGKDPVKVVREALAEALVIYYPFAGRLREEPRRKLVLECNGEGVLFVEADADVSIEQFGGSLRPPFPCFEELLFDVPGSAHIVNSPLLLFQVTRFRCGGFILAVRLNHVISDGFGLVQFMSTVAKIARGAPISSTLPPWDRHLLLSRNPSRPTCTHPEFNAANNTISSVLPPDDMAQSSFFFGPTELSRLRELLPPNIPAATTFELLAACIWKCRTVALKFNPHDETRMICCVNIRNNPVIALPKGYNGNGFVFSAAVATAEEVASATFGHLVKLLQKAKENVTTEFIRSFVDSIEMNGRAHFTLGGSYTVSDVTRMGFENVDLGWGKAVFGGPARGDVGVFPGYVGLLGSCRNKEGEKGVAIAMSLPEEAMKRFEVEVESMLGRKRSRSVSVDKNYSQFIISAL